MTEVQTRDRRIRKEAKSSPKNSAPQSRSWQSMQSTTGCHDVDSIAQCLRRNTPPSPGIARSLYSSLTPHHAASHGPSVETPPPSRVPSTETPRHHPASCGQSIVTPCQMSGGQTSRRQKSYIWRRADVRGQKSHIWSGAHHVREGRCPRGRCPGGQ